MVTKASIAEMSPMAKAINPRWEQPKTVTGVK